MSIVIAIQSSTQIVLGADSMWTKGTSVVEGPNKIIEKDGSYLGFAGSLRVFNIVEKWFNVYQKTMNISKLYGSLKANGLIQDGRMPYSECQFIVAKPTGVWHIDTDLSITEIKKEFVSCGSASDLVNGYLYDREFKSLEDGVELALNAAWQWDVQCCGIQTITIQKETQIEEQS